jgi:gamma-glutamyltranspeptidase/glutathione hydrolase
VIEYRETAPAAATPTMFGPDDTCFGHRVVGVPGTVRGMALAHARFGRLPWRDVVLPAARLAAGGFTIDATLAASLNEVLAASSGFRELLRVYGKAGGAPWRPGDRLVQVDLAWTLRLIAEEGPDAFYEGAIAERIVAEMREGGGLINAADLAGYWADVDVPVRCTYRGWDVHAPPPPSSGGVCLAQMLNVLERFDLRERGRWTAATLHLMIEAMRRAHADRARHLGDPDFVPVPGHLTSKEYARELARGIDPFRATPSEELGADVLLAPEGDSTTHFSVIDSRGMAVANTYTLERHWGSRVVAQGTGILLNDEMIDFNWRPGVTDRSGSIGTEANQIAPGKRMLSSQTPTVVSRGGRAVLVTGSPGGRTITNTVLCVLINALDFGMDVQAAVDAPRLHHQWFPDVAWFEGVLAHPAAVRQLRRMGHDVREVRQGDAHTIGVDQGTGGYLGAADRRVSGKAAGY